MSRFFSKFNAQSQPKLSDEKRDLPTQRLLLSHPTESNSFNASDSVQLCHVISQNSPHSPVLKPSLQKQSSLRSANLSNEPMSLNRVSSNSSVSNHGSDGSAAISVYSAVHLRLNSCNNSESQTSNHSPTKPQFTNEMQPQSTLISPRFNDIDESAVAPNHSIAVKPEPILNSGIANRRRKAKVASRVCNALTTLHNGSNMMVIQNDLKQFRNGLRLTWRRTWLSKDNTSVCNGCPNNIIFRTTDVWSVNACNDEEMSQLLVGFNISTLKSIGLKTLTFIVELRDYTRVILITDEYTQAYIWFRGLQSLLQSANPLCVKSIPVLICDRLRIGATTILDFMSNRSDLGNKTMVESASEMRENICQRYIHIRTKLNYIIDYSSKYAILDSTLHISLLQQCSILHSQMCRICDCLQRNNPNIDILNITDYSAIIEANWAAILLKIAQIQLQLNLQK